MSVVSMMSFGESGAAIADERANLGGKKYNGHQKLKILDSKMILGGCGSANFLKLSYESLEDSLTLIDEEELCLSDINDVMNASFIRNKIEKKGTILYAQTGITGAELYSGHLQSGDMIDPEIKKMAFDSLESLREIIEASSLLGGIEDDEFKIYHASSDGDGMQIDLPYASIGCGAEEFGGVLSDYFSSIRREKRNVINRQEGLVQLIMGVHAASRVFGVGGTPSIVYMDCENVKIPSEDQCLLASELVRAYSIGLLKKKFVHNSVEKLIVEDVDFEKIEEKMTSDSKKWKEVDRFLRGYRV